MLLAHARNWLKKREAILFNEFHDINKLSIKSKSQKEKKVMLLFDRWNPIHAMDNMLHILMQMAFCQMLLCSITRRATWYAAQCSNENSVKLLGQSFSSMVVSYFCSVFYHRKNIRIWNVYCSFGSTVPSILETFSISTFCIVTKQTRGASVKYKQTIAKPNRITRQNPIEKSNSKKNTHKWKKNSTKTLKIRCVKRDSGQ